MIRKLLDRIIALTEPGLGAMLSSPNTQLVIGPLATVPTDTFPRMALYPGAFEMSQSARELRSSEPRPMELRESFPINGGSPQGPYALNNTPLEGSMLAKLVFDQGLVSERRQLIQEGADKDFQINYANATLSLNAAPTGASDLQVVYSYVGVFTMLEFQQTFFADIYHSDTAELSQFSTLLNSIILTNQDELISHFNFTDPTSFNSNQYVAQVMLSQIDCISGELNWSETTPRNQVKFQVTGQLKPIKVISDGYSLIEQVRSPGVVSSHPVDVEINID